MSTEVKKKRNAHKDFSRKIWKEKKTNHYIFVKSHFLTFFLWWFTGEHPAAMQHGEHGFGSRIRAGPWWLTLLVATATNIFCSSYCMIRQPGIWQADSRWWVHVLLWTIEWSHWKRIRNKWRIVILVLIYLCSPKSDTALSYEYK
jgi:hypothetical protein